MSHIDDTERNRIREQYGDLMSEEEKEHFPTAQELALKEYEEEKERERKLEDIEGKISRAFLFIYSVSLTTSMVFLNVLMILAIESFRIIDKFLLLNIRMFMFLIIVLLVLNHIKWKKCFNVNSCKEKSNMIIFIISFAFFSFSSYFSFAYFSIFILMIFLFLNHDNIYSRTLNNKVYKFYYSSLLNNNYLGIEKNNVFNSYQLFFCKYYLLFFLVSLLFYINISCYRLFSSVIYFFSVFVFVKMAIKDNSDVIEFDNLSFASGKTLALAPFFIMSNFYMFFSSSPNGYNLNSIDSVNIFIASTFLFLSTGLFYDNFCLFYVINKIKKLEQQKEMLKCL